MSSTTNQSKHFRFPDLPRELREEIYQYLMPQSTNSWLGPVLTFGIRPSNRKSGPPTTPYYVSQTCRQIRRESLFTYHSTKPFTFDFLWHKDIACARRWLACQDETAILSLRNLAFRHGSLDLEHHALIKINLKNKAVSVDDKAFKSCLEGKMVQLVVERLGAIVRDLGTTNDRAMLTKEGLGRMFDVAAMMFGVQWPEGCPVTLCETLF